MLFSRRLAALVSIALAGALAPASFARQQDPATTGDDVAKPDPSAAAPAEESEFQRLAKRKMEYLDDMFGKGFFVYFTDDGVMPRPYLVAAENKPGYDPLTLEQEYAEILGYLYQEFFRQYGALLGAEQIDEPVVAIVFDSKESYEKLFKEQEAADKKGKPLKYRVENPEFMAGYFRPDNEILYQWRQADLWHVMFHEGTHQLVHHATKKWNVPQFRNTPWFQEGIADYMGGHTRTKVYSEEKKAFVSEFKLGQFIQDRFTILMNGLNSEEVFPLKDLCTMTFLEFKGFQNEQTAQAALIDKEGNVIKAGNYESGRNQRATGLIYAQGWALVKFMHDYDNGKYRAYFNEYFKRECKGNAGGQAFAEIFSLDTDEDWNDLETEFRDWVYSDLRTQKPKK